MEHEYCPFGPDYPRENRRASKLEELEAEAFRLAMGLPEPPVFDGDPEDFAPFGW